MDKGWVVRVRILFGGLFGLFSLCFVGGVVTPVSEEGK